MATNGKGTSPDEPEVKTVGDIESQADRDQTQATDLSDTGADHAVEDGGKDAAKTAAQKTVDKFTGNKTAKKNLEV